MRSSDSRRISAGLLVSGLLHLGAVLAMAPAAGPVPPLPASEPTLNLRVVVQTQRREVAPLPVSAMPVVPASPAPVVTRARPAVTRPVPRKPRPRPVVMASAPDKVPASSTLQLAMPSAVAQQTVPVRDISNDERIAAIRQAYLQALTRRIRDGRYYPGRARRQGVQGEALVSFIVDRSGQVSAIRIEQSTGSRVLDRAAIATVEGVSPVDALPAELAEHELELAVPIVFALR